MTIIVGDCVEQMAAMEAASVDAVVCDPPYGLEFMGKTWDRLDADAWRTGGGFTKPGLGERPTSWPAFGSGDTANATCATCGGRMRGANRCQCDEPDWRVKGKPLEAAGADSRQAQGRAMQEWHERWATEALRVLKPGGHLLAFGGTRTSHRLACALEDAGFEIRDTIRELNGEPGEPLLWIYGSGFPKSLDVSKAIDRAAGAERTEIIGQRHRNVKPYDDENGWNPNSTTGDHSYTAPATNEAREWEGWGTAFKPAHEPIIVARKPLAGTVARNVLDHGTGALNIDGCRVSVDPDDPLTSAVYVGSNPGEAGKTMGDGWANQGEDVAMWSGQGRWPANVVLVHADGCQRIGTQTVESNGHFPASRPASAAVGGPVGHAGQDELDERHTKGESVEEWQCVPGCPIAALDVQSGIQKDGVAVGGLHSASGTNAIYARMERVLDAGEHGYGGAGGASRFFYTAKASRAERNAGLEAFAKKPILWSSGEQNPGSFQAEGTEKAARNPHPTVKPVALMRWLVRLVTRPGGTVLDPFAGSGTTGIACALEGMEFIGIEQDADYAKIAEARIAFWTEHGEEALRIVADREAAQRKREAIAETGQLDLLAGL